MASPTPTSTPAPTTSPVTSSVPPTTITQRELIAHFIDVGQGDSILIDHGDTEVLIDGGGKSTGLVDYLKKYVDGPLEVMVATHPHADHIGGLIGVLGAFQVQQIWYNGGKSSTVTYNQFMAAIQAEKADVHVGKRGDRVTTGSLIFTILSPFNLLDTDNNDSLVLHLSFDQSDFLFMGDAEQEAEAAMLVAKDLLVPDVDVFKVGHHGSRTASSTNFLATARPEIAIYMAGVGNDYGHPHQETLTALAGIGTKVYGTDVFGTIVIRTDGKDYSVTTTKGN